MALFIDKLKLGQAWEAKKWGAYADACVLGFFMFFASWGNMFYLVTAFIFPVLFNTNAFSMSLMGIWLLAGLALVFGVLAAVYTYSSTLSQNRRYYKIVQYFSQHAGDVLTQLKRQPTKKKRAYYAAWHFATGTFKVFYVLYIVCTVLFPWVAEFSLIGLHIQWKLFIFVLSAMIALWAGIQSWFRMSREKSQILLLEKGCGILQKRMSRHTSCRPYQDNKHSHQSHFIFWMFFNFIARVGSIYFVAMNLVVPYVLGVDIGYPALLLLGAAITLLGVIGIFFDVVMCLQRAWRWDKIDKSVMDFDMAQRVSSFPHFPHSVPYEEMDGQEMTLLVASGQEKQQIEHDPVCFDA